MTIPRRGRPARAAHAAHAVRDGDEIRCDLPLGGAPETMGGFLGRRVAELGDRVMFRERAGGGFRATSWAEFAGQVTAFGRFLESHAVAPGDRVAVFSANRGEMLVAEFAAMAAGAIHVPVFPGYPAEQATALAAHAAPTVLIVAGAEQLERVAVPASVRALVSFDPLPPGAASRALAGRAATSTTFAEALRRFTAPPGALLMDGFLERAARRDPDEPCLMLYTSGTTGLNKGVLLTHDNLLSQQRALTAAWTITPADRFLSYLPWHHSFGGNFEKYAALWNGAVLTLDDGHGRDVGRLLANWKAVRPTVYFSVPKIFQQLVTHAETHPEDAAWLFHDELRFVFTAAAPLPANLAAFFAARGIAVQEGWGLTETAPCCTVTDPAEARTVPGMVGYPIPGVRIRVAPDGEILVRGPNVMRGYFANPEATAQALPGDGWFHTGDLGELAGAGLRLVSRKDRVFKLLNAEKVVPTEIENRLAGSNPYIRHVIVTGSGRDFLSAVIFPDFYRIREEFGDDRDRADQAVKASLRECVLAFNRSHPVPYERIQAFAVVSRELTVESQELTPSLKVRFRNVLESVEEYVDAVYEPDRDCDCRFLRKVMRLTPDERRCVAGRDVTLDRCHECASFVFDDAAGAPPAGGSR